MKTLHSLVFGALVLAGCGKNEAVKAYEELAEEACKCTDLDCLQKASKHGEEVMKAHAGARGTDADAKAIKEAGDKLQACTTKLMQSLGQGSGTPPAGGTTPPAGGGAEPVPPQGAGSGSAAPAGSGSGSAAPAGSGSGSAAPAGSGSGSAAPAGSGSGSAAPAGSGSGSAPTPPPPG